VLLLVLLSREHLDELNALCHQSLDLVPVHHFDHKSFLRITVASSVSPSSTYPRRPEVLPPEPPPIIVAASGPKAAELALPAHFEAAVAQVGEEGVAQSAVCGPDPLRMAGFPPQIPIVP
jgi:hypothetical protein